MTPSFTADNSEFENLLNRLQDMERRLEFLETQLRSKGLGSSRPGQYMAAGEDQDSEEEMLIVDEAAIESKVGEYGLAWLGSLVLLFGIVFMMTFSSSTGYPVLASVLGYASAAGGFILTISVHLLIYYVTLQLYFFTAHPLLPWKEADIALLIAAIIVQLFFAMRQSSELLAGIAVTLIIATALISDSLNITMPLITVAAVFALYFFYRYNWWQLLVVSLILVYLSHIAWVINNPLLGHTLDLLPSHPYSLGYLFAVGAIYSLSVLIKRDSKF